MKLSHQEYERICVLMLSGEFVADDVEQFRRTINERLAGDVRHLLLDCEHLEFVDSAGLEEWLALRDRVATKGGQLRLVRPDDSVSSILRVTRLDRAFEVHSTIETAVRSVR